MSRNRKVSVIWIDRGKCPQPQGLLDGVSKVPAQDFAPPRSRGCGGSWSLGGAYGGALDDAQWLESLLGAYGYVVVGLIVALESMGLPLPGETVLLAAAAYAGAGGPLNVAGVIGSASAGAILGDTVGYWLGRVGGLPLLERYGRYIWLSRRKVARARVFFERHGGKTVFLGRFVAFLRMFTAFLAGVGKMPYGRFLTYNVLGGVCWARVRAVSGTPRPNLHFSSARCGG